MFNEVSDTFELWAQYTLEAVDETTWQNAESLIELMETEIIRIIKLSYDPASNTGSYFRTDSKWDNRDDFTEQTQRINRVLTISLIKLQSRTTAVAVGYGGIIVMDVSKSDGSGLPGTNYQFTEVYNVTVEEGWDTIEEIVAGTTPYGQGVPVHFTSKFSGIFQASIYAKFGDIGSSGNMLNQMYQILTSGSYQGELPRIYFIQTTKNIASPANTLTDNVAVKITRFSRIYDQEQLVGIRLTGKVFRPSTLTFV